MWYVTEDRRVKALIDDVHAKKITRETFIESVKSLGFVGREVTEAINKLDDVTLTPLDAG